MQSRSNITLWSRQFYAHFHLFSVSCITVAVQDIGKQDIIGTASLSVMSNYKLDLRHESASLTPIYMATVFRSNKDWERGGNWANKWFSFLCLLQEVRSYMGERRAVLFCSWDFFPMYHCENERKRLHFSLILSFTISSIIFYLSKHKIKVLLVVFCFGWNWLI